MALGDGELGLDVCIEGETLILGMDRGQLSKLASILMLLGLACRFSRTLTVQNSESSFPT